MRVTWTEDAKDRLADLYITLSLDDQREVAQTVLRMNRLLAIHPDQLGESRDGWERVWFEGRLMIRFEIFPHEDEVVVNDVTLLRSRHS
jgi:hypothetical protein